jgi:plastocyanin
MSRFVRLGSLLLAAAAGALLVAAPAHATNGAWPARTPGLQHLHFETGPITVKPGQNTVENVQVPASQKPKVDGYLVAMRPDLEYLDGTVPPVDVIHLHHGVWMNASGTSPAAPIGQMQPIFFGGEEKTVFRIPQGYGLPYKASDTWVLNQMIHNNKPNRTKVRLVWDLDFIPASTALAKKVTPVVPLWMDVRRGWLYPVFDTIRGTGGADGALTYPDEATSPPYRDGNVQNEFTMPFDGTAVAAVGHLHPGGLYDDIDVVRPGATLPSARACRRVAVDQVGSKSTKRCVRATRGTVGDSTRVFRSEAKYYDPAGPVSWDVSLTASRPDWRVRLRSGDRIRITSTYENKISSWYENMGIVMLYVARGDTSGVDPFAQAVDWRGVLTHGHLQENDNHGGGPVVDADARRVASGPAASEVDIKDYQYRPGDLGLLSNGGKVPTVAQGQSLTFVNRDRTAFEWHSITTCAAPCNRTIGISYPLANGPSGGQFDSGQLGVGPEPAAGTVEWKTPTSLRPGTYTYFCRVHNFMRGAFRVTKLK